MKRVAINGFGRIGRMVFRKMMKDNFFDIVAINSSYEPHVLAHLITYDSVHGVFHGDIGFGENFISVNNKKVLIVNNRNPLELPWGKLGIDVVVEATGKFRTKDTAGKHLIAGAKKVIITAPGKDDTPMFVFGVNENEYDEGKHHIISNASCTTNALAPLIKILDEKFTIINGLMTTVHAYTNDQNNLDNPHKDLRRARSCGQSIIPTSTGAAKSIGQIMPNLDGKLNGLALRVPTPNVSTIDLVVDVDKNISVEEVNDTLEIASKSNFQNILGYSKLPLVSIDFVGSQYSTIVDGLSTMTIGSNKIKILSWYDNEWGYSCRVVDLAKYILNK